MFSIWEKQWAIPSISASGSSEFQFISDSGRFGRVFVCFSQRGYSSPARTPHWLHVSASGDHRLGSLFYSVRQLHYIYHVDAEEDVQDFCPLCPGLDPSESVVLFLCPERAFHRGSPHSGKFLSDKVFLLFFSPNGRPLFTKDVCIPLALQ